MNEALNEKCELLIRNRKAVISKFFLDDQLLCLTASLIYTAAGREVDVEELKQCRKILEKNTGVMSNLRANPKLILLSKMATSDDPESYLGNVRDVYAKIHGGKQLENSYMLLAAIQICDLGREQEADELIAKAESIRERMNKDHPFLTASEDTSFIMLLALTEKSVDTIISDIEEAYVYLKDTCKTGASANSIQALSEVLAVSYGDTKEKCDRAVRIFNAFKDRKVKYGKDSEFAVLGSLIDINIDTDTLVNEIIETEAFLDKAKIFKEKETDDKKRLMYASMLAAEVFGKQSAVMDNSIITNTLSTVIGKQISMAITIAMNLVSAAIPAAAGDEDTDKDKDTDGEKKT